MAISIPGGATMAADGKTWQDANGKALNPAQVAAIERLHADASARRAEAEAARLASEAQGNPIASALMALLGRSQPPPSPRGPSALELDEQAVVDAIGQEYADKLMQAGYDGMHQITQASDEELLAIEGIGPATVKKLRAAQR